MQVEDVLGRQIEIPQKIDRLLALGGSLREVLCFGMADKVVGIEYREKPETTEKEGVPQGSDLPYMLAFPKLYDLPIVNVGAGGSGFDYEKIITLNPDIIFIGASKMEAAEDLQKKTNIPVIALYSSTIGTAKQYETFYHSLRVTGKVLGKEERAEELIDMMESYFQDLNERVKDIPDSEKPGVYIGGRAFYGSHGLSGTDPQWPSFNLVKAKNVAGGLSEMSCGISIDKEALVGWNPDIIFISPVSLSVINSELTSTPYKDLKAVKEKKVYYVLPYCWYSYNKENAIVDAYFVGKILYPDQFKDIDVDEKGIEIFEKFYPENGKDTYLKLKDKYHAFREAE
jgi:iron complex transport system substrate-binding protein